MAVTDRELRIPDDETPARCPHCGRPFRSERQRALHVGEDHADDCTADQRASYEDAREAEAEDLFVYHLKVVAALVGIYAFFVFAYMAVSLAQAPG
ncbi:hypothetical protein NGM10_15630 (plasmid) [Halorussus salilacus]|uniref:DUF7410 domain-containing protein n=1 Tax=Halorussus salilacus TaxID=2953750 RepID=UPI00209FB50D|nr:hypothetical protein [Halorussus salilacus]USZ69835.1 hypothetical protein NGM10_15630 [Halorussus salilacus]